MIRFSQLERIIKGKPVFFFEDRLITSLSIDSRKATAAPGTLFFAIAGERHNAHRFIHELYQRGIRQFVVERAVDNVELFPEANIIQVSSSIQALQRLVAFHRTQFTIPVVGITGSNGKTIIKEWLFQMLSKKLNVVKNPGSYNSQVGVPLSVWQIQPHHQIGIFEAGISRPDEMQNLAQVIQPTIGIFSTIGSAHDEGFSDREQKIQEKLRLFDEAKVVIYCKDHAAIDRAAAAHGLKKLFTWGYTAGADIVLHKKAAAYDITYNKHTFSLTLPFSDPASVENCFHCVALLVWLKHDPIYIQECINSLRTVHMRLELKEGINHCQLIDDTYNNDLAGLEISLQFLLHQHQRTRKRVILSDILESGLEKDALVKQIAELLQRNKVDNFIGVGKVLSEFRNLFPASASFYESTEAFLTDFNVDQLHDEVILVKGARAFQFEKIVSRLQRKVHGTVMEINLGALVNNLNFFRSRLRPSTRIMVMVKAFAYGSGSNEIANILQYHKIDYLGVAYADEGVDLRKNHITLPIMVMNPSEESFDSILTYNLEPEIYSFKIFKALTTFLNGKTCHIHIKLDTGMHRLGFEERDLGELINILTSNPNIKVASIFSHLAGADELQHDTFSTTQAEKFSRWADAISEALGYKPLYHILNTPGILRLPHLQFDMVRLGIGLYGVDPTTEGFHELKPVATLKTIISQVRNIAKGESIGYGRKGMAEHDMTLATIAVGYADGFSRAFSRGVGHVLINGKRAPVIGNVCMDMSMIDITGIDANEGDEVILFGTQLPIQEVAASIKTIPYEILTNTSERVKRVFVAESI
jgi:alanine racemase